MTPTITIDGIDNAISNLGYRNINSIKYKLIHALRKFYISEDSISTLTAIDTDEIIKCIWDVGDDRSLIQAKRKNFNSVKSTINADLTLLYNQEKNSEGITINPSNLFDMSDNAKNNLLSSFTSAVQSGKEIGLGRISEILNMINNLLSGIDNFSDKDPNQHLENIKEVIKGLSEKIGTGNLYDSDLIKKDDLGQFKNTGSDKTGKGADGGIGKEDLHGDGENRIGTIDNDQIEEVDEDEMEEVDVDEIEEVDEDDIEEIDEDEIQEVEKDQIEAVDEDEIEEVDEDDIEEIDEDEIQEVEENQIEAVDEDEIEEVDEDDIEEIDEDEIQEVEEDQIEAVDEDDIEEVDEVDIEEIDEDEIQEVDEDQIEAVDEDEIEEVDEDDIEEIDEDEIQGVEEDQIEAVDEDEIEEVDEDDIEEIDEDEIQEVEEDQIEAVDEDEIEAVDEDEIEEVDEDEIEEVDEDEIEEVDETEIEEVDEEAQSAGTDEGPAQQPGGDGIGGVGGVGGINSTDEDQIEAVDEDEIEEVDEDDIEEIDEDQIGAVDLDEIEEVDEDEIEEVDEDEIEEVDEDEIEEVDETEIEEVDEEAQSAGTDEGPAQQPGGDGIGGVGGVGGINSTDEDQIGAVDVDEIEEVDEEEIEEVDETEFDNMKALAEQFDTNLSTMERRFNQNISIPSGKYLIGKKNPEKDELPEQIIHVSGFPIGKYPVTNSLFEAFIENTGYKTTAEHLGYGTVYLGRFQKSVEKTTGIVKSFWRSTFEKKRVDGAYWYQPFGPGSNLHKKRYHPVVQVSFQDALAFSAWTGKRLPSEFEWEAAARTQNGYLFPWGNAWQDDSCNIETSAISDTTPVDHYSQGENSLGVADSLGNVLEWTSDECKPPFAKAGESKYHIAKGGNWTSTKGVTLANRMMIRADFTSNLLGFRCITY